MAIADALKQNATLESLEMDGIATHDVVVAEALERNRALPAQRDYYEAGQRSRQTC